MSFLSKGNNRKKFRLFYATDIHGSERTYRKFVNAGKFYEADALIMGGDITGKMLIPIISEGNGNHRATLQGQTEHLTTQAELDSLTQRLGTLGLYHKTMGQDEFQELIGCYSRALLVAGQPPLKSFQEHLLQLEKESFLSGSKKALVFSGGPCCWCEECDEQQCRFPEKRRPSLESCGCDVFALAESCGIP
ncbi:MAG: hypothetical protein HGB17_15060, partial [Syntrophobacteraceae bacterium]|nr:hypothetical protein [Syntrophobacteraceae bacterium]